MSFAKFPTTPSVAIQEFHPCADQSVLDELSRRLHDTPPLPETYETLGASREQTGVTKQWMEGAISAWKTFDWRRQENRINSFNNYKASLQLDDVNLSVHFVALFSEKEKAVPVCFIHGWPGSFLEFLPMIEHLKSIYTPETLPVHVIIPSLIGYGYSSPPPTDREFVTADNAILFNQLMKGLGFDAYITQGGDIGSMVAPLMGESFDEVKGVHVNYLRLNDPQKYDTSSLDDYDRTCVERMKHFDKYETAYALEHGTKTSTISFVVHSSPVALLAWIGEKFLVWSDPSTTPPLETILADITLHYVQSTFATGLYHYRSNYGTYPTLRQSMDREWTKPLGFSLFPYEIRATPISWAKQWKKNIVWARRHERGGHFAALECPKQLWEDVYEFLKVVWPDV